MAESRGDKELWIRRKSGLLIPSGKEAQYQVSSSKTYLQIKGQALALIRLFQEAGVSLPSQSDLVHLIDSAKALSDLWLAGGGREIDHELLFHAALLDRIANCVLRLEGVEGKERYLRILASKNLKLLKRVRSEGKNLLWELELWEILLRRSMKARLHEPPDIVVEFDNSRIGIACKKIYSERHVQNVLSEAVAQIEGHYECGIVAINLDDLMPGDSILRARTTADMARRLDKNNVEFLKRHERHFRKYLASGRLISALVSTAMLVDTYQEKQRFQYARQSTIWTIPGLAANKDAQLKQFYRALM